MKTFQVIVSDVIIHWFISFEYWFIILGTMFQLEKLSTSWTFVVSTHVFISLYMWKFSAVTNNERGTIIKVFYNLINAQRKSRNCSCWRNWIGLSLAPCSTQKDDFKDYECWRRGDTFTMSLDSFGWNIFDFN